MNHRRSNFKDPHLAGNKRILKIEKYCPGLKVRSPVATMVEDGHFHLSHVESTLRTSTFSLAADTLDMTHILAMSLFFNGLKA